MDAVFAPTNTVACMLAYESAWAQATAECGLIPAAAAARIAEICASANFDLSALAKATRLAGNPVIPFLAALTAAVAARDPVAANYVHWGATSQDVLDTALMLQVRAALALLEAESRLLRNVLSALCAQHAHTPLIARTLLQHAEPTTFGLKIAGWLSGLNGARAQLRQAQQQALAIQFGGASGTLSALGKHGLTVNADLAARLELPMPDLPWHAHRQRIVEIGAAMALLLGTLGKLARDLSLMTQSEVAEVQEPWQPGRGASSAMPQKRNPVSCAVVLAAATRAPGLLTTLLAGMAQEHERGLGGWHAEWETLPELCRLSAGALAHLREVCSGLQVNTAQMQRNLAQAQGQAVAATLALALTPLLGGMRAHALVTELCTASTTQQQNLRTIAGADATVRSALNDCELDEIFTVAHDFGMNDALIARALRDPG